MGNIVIRIKELGIIVFKILSKKNVFSFFVLDSHKLIEGFSHSPFEILSFIWYQNYVIFEESSGQFFLTTKRYFYIYLLYI